MYQDSRGSSWIKGLEWMRRDKSDMPLADLDHVRVEKPIEDEIMVECYPEPYTGKFTTARVELVPEKEDSDVDPKDEFVDDHKDDFDDDTEEMTIPFSVLVLHAGKGVAGEQLVDPAYHGWRKALRIVGYLQSWISIYKHKSHNEVQFDCKICMMGNSLWDPLTEEKRSQDYLFRWETERIKLNLKPVLVSKYVEQQGMGWEKRS